MYCMPPTVLHAPRSCICIRTHILHLQVYTEEDLCPTTFQLLSAPAFRFEAYQIFTYRNKATKGASKALRKGTGTKRRAIAGAITGLSAASLLAVPQADAAQEVMQLAASEPHYLLSRQPSRCL